MYIIDFIKNEPNWREVLAAAPYCLTIREDDDLVLFKYSQLKSDFFNPIVKEARGLILEKGTWKIVRHSFDKFFNFGEPAAAQINWKSKHLNVTEKMDGTLISLYWYKGEWRMATNANISAYSSPLEVGGYKTFGDLAAAAFKAEGLIYERLNKDYTWTFEICSPFNQVVCRYDKLCAFLIGIRVNETGKEINPLLYSEKIGVPAAKSWQVTGLEDCEKIVESLTDNQEGIVVWDMETGTRLKMKTEKYFELHYLASNHNLSNRRIYDLILKNDTDEFLTYFPAYKPIFENCRKILKDRKNYYLHLNEKVNNWKNDNPAATRKEFLSWAITQLGWKEYSNIFWLAYDNKLFEYMDNIEDVCQLIRFYRL